MIRAGENVGLITPARSFMYTPAAAAGDADERYLAAYRVLLCGTIERDSWISRH